MRSLSLAVYHLVLRGLRLLLIVGRRVREADEVRIYHRTAWLLFLSTG